MQRKYPSVNFAPSEQHWTPSNALNGELHVALWRGNLLKEDNLDPILPPTEYPDKEKEM